MRSARGAGFADFGRAIHLLANRRFHPDEIGRATSSVMEAAVLRGPGVLAPADVAEILRRAGDVADQHGEDLTAAALTVFGEMFPAGPESVGLFSAADLAKEEQG